MDLHTITAIITPETRAALPPPSGTDAYLAGGTWIFSEPQLGLRRLIDLTRLGWPALEVADAGLRIGATCTIAQLATFEPPADWVAGPLIVQCCRALLGSFKIWNIATVGGNLCLALPAGPMIALCTALDGTCVIWMPDGKERVLLARDFVTGPQENVLRSGEVLRAIDLPLAALRRRTAFRQISLSPQGRSGALMIGTLGAEGFTLTVTAATRRPMRLVFDAMPEEDELQTRLAAEIPEALYYDDVHGRPDWRRHMTKIFAGEIRRELKA